MFINKCLLNYLAGLSSSEASRTTTIKKSWLMVTMFVNERRMIEDRNLSYLCWLPAVSDIILTSLTVDGSVKTDVGTELKV